MNVEKKFVLKLIFLGLLFWHTLSRLDPPFISFESNFLKTCEIWYKNAKFWTLMILENHICSYFCMSNSPFGVPFHQNDIFKALTLLPCSQKYWQVLQEEKKPKRSNHQTTNNENLGTLLMFRHGKEEIASKFNLKSNWLIRIWHKNDH